MNKNDREWNSFVTNILQNIFCNKINSSNIENILKNILKIW